MAQYKLLFKQSAKKDLSKLPKQFLKNVLKRLTGFETNPFPHGNIKLSGSNEFYRIRVGDFRIVYSVNNKLKIVIVWYVRHRKDVYKVI
ncbi:MAG: type II toxin-antitoxin system RelE/ParE family toxin [Ignavibacteria bacterium]|nr:type II toxin-antitoxin system RelE/ParE family toxin [Ignavibacteria bacterium]